MTPLPVQERRVLMAAGGTGGHIYPAVAVAQALATAAPDLPIQFCCGNRPTELEIYGRLDIEPWVLPVAHNRPGLLNKLGFARDMTAAWLQSLRLLRDTPVAVAVGFGSYVSISPLLAAHRRGARLLLHESNVHAGAANRFLARRAARICIAEPSLAADFPAGKVVETGNPIRAELLRPRDRATARAVFGLDPAARVLLCVGGSQGSGGINRLLLEYLEHAAQTGNSPWRLLWATGAAHYAEIRARLDELFPVKPGTPRVDAGEQGLWAGHAVAPYLADMANAYAAADAVLGRGGALTQAEFTALGLPAILVPLRTRDQHQLVNARKMQERGAARVLMDDDPAAAATLAGWLAEWAAAPAQLDALAAAARQIGRPQAADMIAAMILELMEIS